MDTKDNNVGTFRKLLRECKECWITTLLVVVLFVVNGVHIAYSCRNHDFSLPIFVKVFDYLK